MTNKKDEIYSISVNRRINPSYRWRISSRSYKYRLIIVWIMSAPARPIRQLIGILHVHCVEVSVVRTSSSLKFWLCQMQLQLWNRRVQTRVPQVTPRNKYGSPGENLCKPLAAVPRRKDSHTDLHSCAVYVNRITINRRRVLKFLFCENDAFIPRLVIMKY